MIKFNALPDDHADLIHSPLLRAALLTLTYAKEHGAIGLTLTKAFKRVFVHWAVENFNWPGSDAEFMFKHNKVINEFEFPPLGVAALRTVRAMRKGHAADLARRHTAFGLTDFAVAISTAILTGAVIGGPYILIPLFLVPMAVLAHLAVLDRVGITATERQRQGA